MPGRASIIFPAQNEEHRVGNLLDILCDASIGDAYDIFVICSGCTDRTRDVAEKYPRIVVVEIDELGECLALNEGDRLAGDAFPRLYGDADIQISPASIAALVEVLSTDEVKVAGPSIRYNSERSTWLIRMFFRAQEIPGIVSWHDGHLVGRGLYGASRAARQRFGPFRI